MCIDIAWFEIQLRGAEKAEKAQKKNTQQTSQATNIETETAGERASHLRRSNVFSPLSSAQHQLSTFTTVPSIHSDDEISVNQSLQSPDQEYNPGEVPEDRQVYIHTMIFHNLAIMTKGPVMMLWLQIQGWPSVEHQARIQTLGFHPSLDVSSQMEGGGFEHFSLKRDVHGQERGGFSP